MKTLFRFLALSFSLSGAATGQIQIQNLPSATQPLSGFEYTIVSQNGLTLKAPVNSFGTSAFGTQTANTIFAGPASGPVAMPAFRPLALNDIPSGILRTTGGTMTGQLAGINGSVGSVSSNGQSSFLVGGDGWAWNATSNFFGLAGHCSSFSLGQCASPVGFDGSEQLQLGAYPGPNQNNSRIQTTEYGDGASGGTAFVPLVDNQFAGTPANQPQLVGWRAHAPSGQSGRTITDWSQYLVHSLDTMMNLQSSGADGYAPGTLSVVNGTMSSGGTAYCLTNVLTLTGGTVATLEGANDVKTQITVDATDGSSGGGCGVVTAWHVSTLGAYTALPAVPNSPTGGAGTGFTLSAITSSIHQNANSVNIATKIDSSASTLCGWTSSNAGLNIPGEFDIGVHNPYDPSNSPTNAVAFPARAPYGMGNYLKVRCDGSIDFAGGPTATNGGTGGSGGGLYWQPYGSTVRTQFLDANTGNGTFNNLTITGGFFPLASISPPAAGFGNVGGYVPMTPAQFNGQTNSAPNSNSPLSWAKSNIGSILQSGLLSPDGTADMWVITGKPSLLGAITETATIAADTNWRTMSVVCNAASASGICDIQIAYTGGHTYTAAYSLGGTVIGCASPTGGTAFVCFPPVMLPSGNYLVSFATQNASATSVTLQFSPNGGNTPVTPLGAIMWGINLGNPVATKPSALSTNSGCYIATAATAVSVPDGSCPVGLNGTNLDIGSNLSSTLTAQGPYNSWIYELGTFTGSFGSPFSPNLFAITDNWGSFSTTGTTDDVKVDVTDGNTNAASNFFYGSHKALSGYETVRAPQNGAESINSGGAGIDATYAQGRVNANTYGNGYSARGTLGGWGGGIFAANPQTIIAPNVLYWANEISDEDDCQIGAGSIIAVRLCHLVSTKAANVVEAEYDDAGYSLVSDAAGGTGVRAGLAFGGFLNTWPIDPSHGSLIAIEPRESSGVETQQALFGIDFRPLTIASGGDVLALPGLGLDGSGVTHAQTVQATNGLSGETGSVSTVAIDNFNPAVANNAGGGGVYPVTSFPTISVAAPPAGGTQATITVATMYLNTIAGFGSTGFGYSVNDFITINAANFTASLTAPGGTTTNFLVVSAVKSGFLQIGATISGSGITGNPTILSGPANGGTGTYYLSVAQSTVSSESMTAASGTSPVVQVNSVDTNGGITACTVTTAGALTAVPPGQIAYGVDTTTPSAVGAGFYIAWASNDNLTVSAQNCSPGVTGKNYAGGDTLTTTTGTGGPAVFTVDAVDNYGGILNAHATTPGAFTALPNTNPYLAFTTSGSGSAANIFMGWGIATLNYGGAGGSNAGAGYPCFPPLVTPAQSTVQTARIRITAMTCSAAPLPLGGTSIQYVVSSTKSVAVGLSTPSISSGFGTSPSVVNSNGTAAFTVNVGTGGTATSGVVALNATASHGWACSANDITNNASFVEGQTATSTTTATFANYSRTTGASIAWTASDVLQITCTGY